MRREKNLFSSPFRLASCNLAFNLEMRDLDWPSLLISVVKSSLTRLDLSGDDQIAIIVAVVIIIIMVD